MSLQGYHMCLQAVELISVMLLVALLYSLFSRSGRPLWYRKMPTLTSHIPVPQPSYSQARENLVKAIPPRILCLLACGGVDCRYEGPECWKANQQAIRGLFSSWWDFTKHLFMVKVIPKTFMTYGRVTDDIIAMARPSKRLIERYNIIEQFRR